MKRENFLNYIKNAVLSEDIDLRYDRYLQKFIFYINNIEFNLISTPISVFLLLEDHKKGLADVFKEEFILTEDEGIDFVKHFTNILNVKKDNSINENSVHQEKITYLGIERYNKIILELKNILKKINVEKELENFVKDDYIDNYDHKLIVDNVLCQYLLGKLCYNNKKEEALLTSLLIVPVIIYYDGVEKNTKNTIMYEITIPSYEVKEYPVLNSFIIDHIFRENDFERKIDNVINNFPNGNAFVYNVLNYSLDGDKKESKRNKI